MKNTTVDKNNNKLIAIVGIILGAFVAVAILCIVAAQFILVDTCVSPCPPFADCAPVCKKESLWNHLFNRPQVANDVKFVEYGDYTVYGANEYGDISIYVGDNGIIVEYDEPIVCIQAPCPNHRLRTKVGFANNNMAIVYNFLGRLQDKKQYDDLSYRDQRVLMSMALNEEDKIQEYAIAYYVDNVYYSIKETSGSISVKNEGRSRKSQTIDLTPKDETEIEKIRQLIYKYCSRKNDYQPDLYPTDLDAEDLEYLNRLLKLN